MACEHIRFPNGQTAIVCGRRRARPRRCRFCGAAAGLLCDFVLRGGRTCNAPLCVSCAKRQRVQTLTGDSVDHCPTHAEPAQLELAGVE